MKHRHICRGEGGRWRRRFGRVFKQNFLDIVYFGCLAFTINGAYIYVTRALDKSRESAAGRVGIGAITLAGIDPKLEVVSLAGDDPKSEVVSMVHFSRVAKHGQPGK